MQREVWSKLFSIGAMICLRKERPVSCDLNKDGYPPWGPLAQGSEVSRSLGDFSVPLSVQTVMRPSGVEEGGTAGKGQSGPGAPSTPPQ